MTGNVTTDYEKNGRQSKGRQLNISLSLILTCRVISLVSLRDGLKELEEDTADWEDFF